MAKSAPSFEDRISLIAAELSELGKRPVSSETYDELTSLQERLGDIVGEFIMCEGCSGMFPAAVQVTIGDVTATLCRNCAITAIQKDTLELSPERAAPRPRRSESLRSNRPKSDSQPARISVPDPVDDDDDVPVDSDEPEPDESSPDKPAPYVSRPRTRSQSRSIRKASTTDDDEVFVQEPIQNARRAMPTTMARWNRHISVSVRVELENRSADHLKSRTPIPTPASTMCYQHPEHAALVPQKRKNRF